MELLANATVKALRGKEQLADGNRHNQLLGHFAHQGHVAGLTHLDPAARQHAIIVIVLAADQHMAIADGDPGHAIVEPRPARRKAQDGADDRHSSLSSKRLCCSPTKPCGTTLPRCWKAAPVSMRPRGVRWMNPCWIRYGSTISSIASRGSLSAAAMVSMPTGPPL